MATNITMKLLEEQIKKAFENKPQPKGRRITIITWEGGMKMFSEALKKEAEKYATGRK